MEVSYKRTFIKDIKRLPGEFINKIEKIIFKQIPEASNLTEVRGVKKIKGYKNYYRIRIGEYRLGIKYYNDKVTFMRVLHRKEIYKYFP